MEVWGGGRTAGVHHYKELYNLRKKEIGGEVKTFVKQRHDETL